ncbi:MAG: formyltransferase [Deltaproteobacteria bacterium]|nr:formyltransferase [Deltaproteobacteria bacterium]
MRTVVFAYHNMGLIGLDALLRNGFDVELVFTHKDNPDENVWYGSVRDFCRSHQLDYVEPEDPNTQEWIELVKKIAPDIMFSFYYRKMLSQDLMSIPRLGSYNLHGSLLPQYRGRCPVNWVLINGEDVSGVTLHEMVEKPDAGPIVSQKAVSISFEDTALSLYKKLESAAKEMLDEVLPDMREGNILKKPQALEDGSYFGGRRPEDGRIDWGMPAKEIYNLIRAVTRPYPGAFGYIDSKKVFFWWAKPVTTEHLGLSPGEIGITDGGMVQIGTGKGVILPYEVEVDGTVLKAESLVRFFANLKERRVR